MLIQSQQAQKKEHKKLSDDLDDLKLSESCGKVDKEVHQSPVKASAESLDLSTPSIVENLVKEEIVDQKEEQDKIEDAVAGGDQEQTKKTESLDTSKGLIKDCDGKNDKTKANQEEGMDLDKDPSDDKTGGGEAVIDTRNVEQDEGDEDVDCYDEDDDDQEEISIDPRTYCKLGHFHLLLEDYAKGEEEDDQDQKLLK